MKTIKMEFILLGKRKELVISLHISSIANFISRNIIHTILEINNRARKNY